MAGLLNRKKRVHSKKVKLTLVTYDEKSMEVHSDISIWDAITLSKSAKVSWINVDDISDPDVVKSACEGFGIHQLVQEDILTSDQRPKLEDYGDYIYAVMKMIYVNGNSVLIEQVSLVFGKNYVLSFQGGFETDVFDSVRKRFPNEQSRLRKNGVDYLAYTLIDSVVDNYFQVIERAGEMIVKLEDMVLNKPKDSSMNDLHIMKRDMIYLRKSVWPLREVISSLQHSESTLVTKNTKLYLRDAYDHTIQVIDAVEAMRDVLSGLQEIYLSNINNRINEIIKVLTIITTIFMPLTFVTGFYGMNVDNLPFAKTSEGVAIVSLVLIGLIFGMLYFFRRLRWL